MLRLRYTTVWRPYHKSESGHLCVSVDGVASLHFALVHLHSDADWFGQLCGPRADLTHEAEGKTQQTRALCCCSARLPFVLIINHKNILLEINNELSYLSMLQMFSMVLHFHYYVTT